MGQQTFQECVSKVQTIFLLLNENNFVSSEEKKRFSHREPINSDYSEKIYTYIYINEKKKGSKRYAHFRKVYSLEKGKCRQATASDAMKKLFPYIARKREYSVYVQMDGQRKEWIDVQRKMRGTDGPCEKRTRRHLNESNKLGCIQ